MRLIELDVDKPEEIARIVGMYVNNFSWGNTQQDFIKNILTEHRTLQQSVLQLFINTIIAAGEQYKLGRYDGRCEYAYEMCSKIQDFLIKEQEVFEGKVSFPCI